MTPKKLALELCKRESGKRQVNIAQMTEIVSRLADLLYDEDYVDEDTYLRLVRLGEKRSEAAKGTR